MSESKSMEDRLSAVEASLKDLVDQNRSLQYYIGTLDATLRQFIDLRSKHKAGRDFIHNRPPLAAPVTIPGRLN